MEVFLKRCGLLALGLLVALAVLILSPPRAADAADFTVNTTNDTNDANTADGICADANGDCSLRAAISQANALAGTDTIYLPAGVYTLTIPRNDPDNSDNAGGDLDIRNSDLNIVGAGAGSTIIQAGTLGGVSGNGVDRVFHIIGSVTVTISDVTIRHGYTAAPNAVPGAGLYVGSNGTVTLNRCIVADNYSQLGQGAGLSLAFGSLTINDCTITGNVTTGFGGAVFNYDGPGGVITINNSTLSGNSAGQGGGLYTAGPTTTLRNSTIANNTGGGVRNAGTGTLTLVNTLLASNTGGNCAGSLTSGGHNLDSGNTCALTAAGDLINTNPHLGSLAANGGPAPTHALLFNSPAIDAGNSTACAAAPISGHDQRGEARNDLRCDIGAFELKLADSAQVQKAVSGAGVYTFGPTLVQMEVTNDGGCLTGLIVAQTSASFPGSPSGLQTGRYWTIAPIGCSSGFSVNLTLPHSLGMNFANARVCRNLDTPRRWDCAVDSATTTSVTRNSIANLSIWAVGDASMPLAVQLAGFSTASQSDHVLVIWETASELNNLGFNVYRSQAAASPEMLLTFVPAHSPGSTLGASYQWADRNVTPGSTYFYWLEDVDLSGATTLHGPVSITYEGPSAVQLTDFNATHNRSADSSGVALVMAMIAVSLRLTIARLGLWQGRGSR